MQCCTQRAFLMDQKDAENFVEIQKLTGAENRNTLTYIFKHTHTKEDVEMIEGTII